MSPCRRYLTKVHSSRMRLLALALAVLAAAGCGDLRWHKPGASASMLEQDLGECQAQARLRSSHFARPFAPDWPRVIGMDARGRPVTAPYDRLDTDRFLYEHDLTRNCMNEKGYGLVPAEKR
jgi:hypothetical protein